MKWTCKRHAQDVKCTTFVRNVLVLCLRALQITSSSNISKTPVFWTQIHYQLFKILLKILSLHVNLQIKCVQTTKKENIHQQPVVILLKNGCSVRHTFCTISVAKILEKHARSSSYLALVFFKENSHSRGKFTERLFLLQLFYTKFCKQMFFRTPISGWW